MNSLDPTFFPLDDTESSPATVTNWYFEPKAHFAYPVGQYKTCWKISSCYSSFLIRKLAGKWYNIIRHYNLNNRYKNYHSDIAHDKGIYRMFALVNLTISAKFGRIANPGVQLQLYIIKYLIRKDWWVIIRSRKNDSFLQGMIFSPQSALTLYGLSYFSSLLNLIIFILDS